MPVSKKRKKPTKSRPQSRTTPRQGAASRSERAGGLLDVLENRLGGVLPDLVEHRNRIRQRQDSLATEAAQVLVAGLIESAPKRTDPELEDDLCTRLGQRLLAFDELPLDDHVNPNQLAESVIEVAAEAVAQALTDEAPRDGPWRVFAAAARIVPYPLSEAAAAATNQLRAQPGGRALPKPDQPKVTGEVRWARDAYGSRFAVTAPIPTTQEPDRCYLWDIDACGHQVVTVHSAYYPSAEQAFEEWRAAVGQVAAGGSTLTPVDDSRLLADLLPAEEGILRVGGENAEQYAEYHRGKRLAEAARKATRPTPAGTRTPLDAATAATEFADWLRENRADQPQPTDLDELLTELADSWQIGDVAALHETCSPHRVALTVLHLSDYYDDEFAPQLVALLPDWISWLATRTGITPELADRCRPYALGETHVDVVADDSRPNYLARVAE